jgi:hypothetical protein
MPKLIDHNPNQTPQGIGEEGLLYFIDEVNEIRARSSNRFRMRPVRKDNGVLGMEDHYAISRPLRPDTPSERFAGHMRLGHG